MPERIAIPKSVRFEVFKRDSFKCQYCGKSAPEIVLHVDHIKPVAEGGDNDILNLVTACSDCNLGKGARRLDDSSVIEKQRKQLEELNDRREQLEMLLQWKEEMSDISNSILAAFEAEFTAKFGLVLTDIGRKRARKILREYGLKKACDAIAIAAEKTDLEGSEIAYINGICRTWAQDEERPYLKDLYYIRGILKNRLPDSDYDGDEVLSFLEDAYLGGVAIQDLTTVAKRATRWRHFVNVIEYMSNET